MKKDEEKLDFESAIKKLDDIANELESGNLNLEESIKMFEEGMMLSSKCSNFLSDAEKRITVLLNENGKLTEENFIAEED